jgi:hypothetical protein
MSAQPQLLQIGHLSSLQREAMILYDLTRAMVFIHKTAGFPAAAELAEGLILQLLGKHPAGQMSALLYESRPSGNFARIKRLFAESEGGLGLQLLSTRDCTQRLTELEELAHRRFALIAAAGAVHIADYNKISPRPEPWRLLLITDIDGLAADSHALQALQNLCQSGPTVGIIPVLFRGESTNIGDNDLDFRLKYIEAFWNAILSSAFGFDLRATPVQPINQPTEVWRLLYKFQARIGLTDTLRDQWVEDLLQRLKSREEENVDQDFLQVEIGLEGIKPAFFRLGEAANSYHALLGGASRSGKSSLLNNLILQICEKYPPETLRLWLFDYREGVEFTLFTGLAHVDVLHVDNEDKQGAIAAFTAFEALMRERSLLFRQNDPPVSRLADYNRHAATPLPRCLLIVDEAQSMFDDRETKPHAKRLLKEVSRKGAAFGLHILLSTQSYQNVELEPDVKGQFRLRVGLQLSSSMECRALMGRDNDAPMTLPRYAAVYNNNFGEARDNRIFSLTALPREELHAKLATLRQRYPAGEPLSFKESDGKTTRAATKTVTDDFSDWDDLTN